jgi:hypothetical protein
MRDIEKAFLYISDSGLLTFLLCLWLCYEPGFEEEEHALVLSAA